MTDHVAQARELTTGRWRDIAREVGLSLRHPGEVMLRHRNGESPPFTLLVLAFLGCAIFGVACYGAVMQLNDGPLEMLRGGFLTPLAAGLAWAIALPALYIFNSALGSRLTMQETLLAASVTVCFGSWAMLASVPIGWFFTLAVPDSPVPLFVHGLVFTGVGICMLDVFVRTLKALEPKRLALYAFVWVGLVGVIGLELFALFGVFDA